MFTRPELEAALNNLIFIKQNGPNHLRYGICFNISYPEDGFAIVKEFAIGWDEHSGNDDCPVPSFNNNRDCWGMYLYARNSTFDGLWDKDTEYGRARWRLVDYLIERITVALQQMPA